MLRRITSYTAASINVAASETIKVPITWELSFVQDSADLNYVDDVVPHKLWKRFKCLSGLVGVMDGKLSVFVMNCAPSKQHLHKGIPITTLSTVVETEVSAQQELRTLEKLKEMALMPGLSSVKQGEVCKLLMQHKAALSTGDKDAGQAGVTAHRIELYDDTPIYQRPQRFPALMNEAIEQSERNFSSWILLNQVHFPGHCKWYQFEKR